MVSRLGIDPIQASPQGDADVADDETAKPLRTKRGVVSLNFTSWNQTSSWLTQLQRLQMAA